MNRYNVTVRIRTASRVTVERRIPITAADMESAKSEVSEYITQEYPTAKRITVKEVEVVA